MIITFEARYIPKREYLLAGARYENNRLALMLRTVDNNEPLAMLTVNFPKNPLQRGEVCIKDPDQAEGICKALVDAGIVHEPLYSIASGFYLYPVCNLTEKGMELQDQIPLLETLE